MAKYLVTFFPFFIQFHQAARSSIGDSYYRKTPNLSRGLN